MDDEGRRLPELLNPSWLARGRPSVVGALTLALSAGCSAGVAPVGASPSTAMQTQSSASVAPAGTAVHALALLRVRGRAPKTGYARGLFGQTWADVDHNGCDTRNDILRRDLNEYSLKAGTHGCLVLKGTLKDPYTGTVINFVRGPQSARVQIDHVVALYDAWQKGAQNWTAPQRTAFANDPLNLLAVDGPANQRKGNGDAATWLPDMKANRCGYVARQVAVKVKYGIWVTAAERDAIARVLTVCPNQKLPAAGPERAALLHPFAAGLHPRWLTGHLRIVGGKRQLAQPAIAVSLPQSLCRS